VEGIVIVEDDVEDEMILADNDCGLAIVVEDVVDVELHENIESSVEPTPNELVLGVDDEDELS
jgi:hypothetical protein